MTLVAADLMKVEKAIELDAVCSVEAVTAISQHLQASGGKRLRPALTIASAEACGGKPAEALDAAAAVECIHTYSLIHDDLPSMDNDDFRRGKPTCHKVFGEGIAVLAGDALLTVAFEILSKARPAKRYGGADFVRELAVASGSLWLVGGQAADLDRAGGRRVAE